MIYKFSQATKTYGVVSRAFFIYGVAGNSWC